MSSSSLINIGNKKTGRIKPRHRMSVVDKYFFLGFCGGFIGSAWLGVHLWLMRNGQIIVSPHYISLRLLHAYIQFYLFLGLFILGFSLHAMPRILRTEIQTPKWGSFLFILLVIGVFLEWMYPQFLYGPVIMFTPFFFASMFIASLCRLSARNDVITIGVPVTFGLFCLALGAFFDLSIPRNALYLFWFGVAPIIFGTGQQFISGFLGGQKMSISWTRIFLLAYVGSLFFAIIHEISPDYEILCTYGFAGMNIAALIIYIIATNLRRATSVLNHPLSWAFCIALFWAIIGNIFILQGGFVDEALHMWALGWAVTLIIATSSQIVSFLANKTYYRTRIIIALLIWQLVPLGRSLSMTFHLRGDFSLVVAAATATVFILWGLPLALTLKDIVRRYFILQEVPSRN